MPANSTETFTEKEREIHEAAAAQAEAMRRTGIPMGDPGAPEEWLNFTHFLKILEPEKDDVPLNEKVRKILWPSSETEEQTAFCTQKIADLSSAMKEDKVYRVNPAHLSFNIGGAILASLPEAVTEGAKTSAMTEVDKALGIKEGEGEAGARWESLKTRLAAMMAGIKETEFQAILEGGASPREGAVEGIRRMEGPLRELTAELASMEAALQSGTDPNDRVYAMRQFSQICSEAAEEYTAALTRSVQDLDPDSREKLAERYRRAGYEMGNLGNRNFMGMTSHLGENFLAMTMFSTFCPPLALFIALPAILPLVAAALSKGVAHYQGSAARDEKNSLTEITSRVRTDATVGTCLATGLMAQLASGRPVTDILAQGLPELEGLLARDAENLQIAMAAWARENGSAPIDLGSPEGRAKMKEFVERHRSVLSTSLGKILGDVRGVEACARADYSVQMQETGSRAVPLHRGNGLPVEAAVSSYACVVPPELEGRIPASKRREIERTNRQMEDGLNVRLPLLAQVLDGQSTPEARYQAVKDFLTNSLAAEDYQIWGEHRSFSNIEMGGYINALLRSAEKLGGKATENSDLPATRNWIRTLDQASWLASDLAMRLLPGKALTVIGQSRDPSHNGKHPVENFSVAAAVGTLDAMTAAGKKPDSAAGRVLKQLLALQGINLLDLYTTKTLALSKESRDFLNEVQASAKASTENGEALGSPARSFNLMQDIFNGTGKMGIKFDEGQIAKTLNRMFSANDSFEFYLNGELMGEKGKKEPGEGLIGSLARHSSSILEESFDEERSLKERLTILRSIEIRGMDAEGNEFSYSLSDILRRTLTLQIGESLAECVSEKHLPGQGSMGELYRLLREFAGKQDMEAFNRALLACFTQGLDASEVLKEAKEAKPDFSWVPGMGEGRSGDASWTQAAAAPEKTESGYAPDMSAGLNEDSRDRGM
jgi:hypothetical protein